MKKMNKKGFTLIELLAVIVILGLLMAIAIPSVTKYITQSRKKTLTNTISNYMSALTTEVNNMEYTFTGTNTIYAVPIECIAVERGGTDPFGQWYPANTLNDDGTPNAASTYWAYVLVQYDDKTASYTYGFTFKDSAGYGLYPTASTKIKESGSQVLTDLEFSANPNTLKATKSGATITVPKTIVDFTALANWSGFKVDATTKFYVLTSGTSPDAVTCRTAQQ